MMVPPPTPNRPLNAPAAVAITASRTSLGDIAGILRRVSAPTAETLAESLARSPPTRSAPPCSATSTARSRRSSSGAEDAHVREEISLLLGRLAAATRCVACVSGRPAAEARRLVGVGGIALRGLPRRRAARARARSGPADARFASWQGRVRRLRARTRDSPRPQAAAHPDRGQGPDQRVPLARRARRGGRRDLARRAWPRRPRPRASTSTGAARCWRSARPCPSTRARRSRDLVERTPVRAALYGGDDVTDLDAFDALDALAEASTTR